MISVPGTINIRTLVGRYGSFNVGTLECTIGSFTIKDSSIDEFDEGSYSGDFVIENIKPNSYFSSGRLVVEIRAKLNAIMLGKGSVPQPMAPQQLEQDPIEEDFILGASEVPEYESMSSEEALELGEDALAKKLFGILYPLGNLIKLDPTINRAVFRQQKEYLKYLGYRFVASEQHWIK